MSSQGCEMRMNVFSAMGFVDADERLAKAELARAIRREIAARGLTQEGVGALMALQLSDVADLVRGRLARFSIPCLERCLNTVQHLRGERN